MGRHPHRRHPAHLPDGYRAGRGAPVLFPALSVHLEDPGRLLDGVDGLFLPGGRDLDADLYGQQAHESNDPPLRVRDELEMALVREARRRGMPTFGACRGLQVINVALGGTLTQHLGDEVELTPHRDVVGVFTSHPVEVEEGTLLERIVGRQSFDIASHHHQSVDALGEGLVATATAPDGIVEAVEAADGSFCLGVQWHPEERLDPEGLDLMKAFVRASAESVA
ncbi:gamma-glutamyl-gamma-aminobutyrate hydrolase family protein [Leucobacter soli]|uniref:gamma-glutamyl-gamma-aminobutyrate hydrolase family protein n=1 Tax=Leucobacter soli TaxID=2812850 RepID=UPI00361EDAB3